MNQGCLRTFAISIAVFGALLGILGLIFLLAPGYALKGIIMLALGLGIVLFAASRLRVIAANTPQSVEQNLSELAAASGGEITLAEAVGRLPYDDHTAAAGLQRLVDKGLAQVEVREGVQYYTFAGLKETKMIKKCPYCGNEYPVSSGFRKCPSCGGNLEIRPQ